MSHIHQILIHLLTYALLTALAILIAKRQAGASPVYREPGAVMLAYGKKTKFLFLALFAIALMTLLQTLFLVFKNGGPTHRTAVILVIATLCLTVLMPICLYLGKRTVLVDHQGLIVVGMFRIATFTYGDIAGIDQDYQNINISLHSGKNIKISKTLPGWPDALTLLLDNWAHASHKR